MKQSLMMLLRLAEIDAALHELEEIRGLVPAEIAELEIRSAALSGEIAAAEKKVADLEAGRRAAEELILEKKGWIERRETQVHDIKTNKEYHAALKEISTARKEIMDTETKIAGFNAQLEEAAKEASALRETHLPRIEEFHARRAECRKSLDESAPLLEERQKARKGALVELDAKIVGVYEQVIRKVKPAMARAADGACTECGTRMRPQLFNRLFHADELLTCPRCKRIMYVEDVLKTA